MEWAGNFLYYMNGLSGCQIQDGQETFIYMNWIFSLLGIGLTGNSHLYDLNTLIARHKMDRKLSSI